MPTKMSDPNTNPDEDSPLKYELNQISSKNGNVHLVVIHISNKKGVNKVLVW